MFASRALIASTLGQANLNLKVLTGSKTIIKTYMALAVTQIKNKKDIKPINEKNKTIQNINKHIN